MLPTTSLAGLQVSRSCDGSGNENQESERRNGEESFHCGPEFLLEGFRKPGLVLAFNRVAPVSRTPDCLVL
jgi:hypothetical protein